MPRVIHTGQALVDATAIVPSLPARGQNVMGESWELAAGGAVNTLLAAARSDAACVHAGAIGTGPNGDLIRDALLTDGVAWSAAPVRDSDTALCLVLVEDSGERTFITMQGAERELSVAALESSRPRVGDLVCLTGYSFAVASTCEPLRAWLAQLDAGVEVVLDPGAAFASLPELLRAELLDRVTVWTSNLEEAQALAGAVGMSEAAEQLADLLPPG